MTDFQTAVNANNYYNIGRYTGEYIKLFFSTEIPSYVNNFENMKNKDNF